MTSKNPSRLLTLTAGTLILSAGLCGPAFAQNGRPAPAAPSSHEAADPSKPAAGSASATQPAGAASRGSRPIAPGKVTLAFNDVPVDDVIFRFIVETTGKVVMPVNAIQLKTKKVTLMNDEPVDRAQALDLLFTALRLNGIGVIETPEVIILDMKENVRQTVLGPVLKPEDDVMSRTDLATYVLKIFRLKEALADNVGNKIESLPDNAQLTVDENSNQILLYGDIATAQHVQSIINELDHNYVKPETRTFQLSYADADAVSTQIYDLFEETAGANQSAGGAQGGGRRNNRPPATGRPAAPGGAPSATPAGVAGPGPSVELRVSVNTKQNSVTVQADHARLSAIAQLINEYWDLPTPPETARMYTLQHTDPLKVKEVLQSLLGQSSGGSRTSGGGRGAAGGGRGGNTGLPGGGNGGAGVSDLIGNIYTIEAYPDKNALVVISKTKEALDYLDSLIEQIDQPSAIGLPVVVELKHAQAVSLADEINVLLSPSGVSSGQGLQRPDTGLSGGGVESASSSSSGSSDTGFGSNLGNRGTTGGAGGGGNSITFPWQSGRLLEDQSEPSPLIGKVRVVPIVRQNALAIVAPVAERDAVTEIIKKLDRPGRQVMISAIIAEVQLNDDMALGLRLSSSAISSSLTDNSIGGSASFEGTKNDIFSSLFDSSVLDLNVDLNVLLQAISEKTNLRILQEPRIFTADNQEAIFFDGQEIPFITDSNTSNVNGGLTQSFEYKKVGVILDVRPRITVEKDVDVEINLELSSVVPGQIILGGAVLDRRQTTTQIIVKNGQTIVLSGIMKDTDSMTTRGVPFLEDVPLIGELFKSRETSKRTSELVAFITPVVVDNPSENDENFNAVERKALQELAKPLKAHLKDTERIRGKIVAPKDPETGRPISLDPSVSESAKKNAIPPTDAEADPHKTRARHEDDGQPMNNDSPPVDIDEPDTEQPNRR